MLYESSSGEEDNENDDGSGKKGGPLSSEDIIDLEDMGKVVHKMEMARKNRAEEEKAMKSGLVEPREMVTPLLHKSLTKQGWFINVFANIHMYAHTHT